MTARYSLLLPGIAVFAAGFVLMFLHAQAYLPVMSNDAMTYHIPAAAQWLQRGRIDLFQTWFFNPANTYSPLAGSTFIAWLIAPFGSDVIARYVEVPALGCIALAVYQLARLLKTNSIPAALVAVAAVLSRPIFMQGLMAKDDLFLAFFFIATLVALSPDRLRDDYGAVRVGIALGLLLATKYTALLAAPILLLALDGTRFKGGSVSKASRQDTLCSFLFRRLRLRECKRVRSPGKNTGIPIDPDSRSRKRLVESLISYPCATPKWCLATAIAVVLAGPWYLRNFVLTGNPLFPVKLQLLHGLFTTSASDAFGSFQSAAAVVVGGSYSLPVAVGILLGIGWALAMILGRTMFRSDPLLRVCLLGPIVGIAIFFLLSPFPEVRFILPEILLLFSAAAFAIRQIPRPSVQIAIAAVMLLACTATVLASDFWWSAVGFAASGIGAAIVVMLLLWVLSGMKFRRPGMILAILGVIFTAGWSYVNWTPYLREYQDMRHGNASGYSMEFPQEEPLWQFVDEHLPANATVAYTNLYLISPLQGYDLHRQLVYVPTRAGVRLISDLPWLGDRLSGEKLIPAAALATVASADREVWLENLKASGAAYLIVGRGGVVGIPPEAAFAANDPRNFHPLFQCDRGWVYAVEF